MNRLFVFSFLIIFLAVLLVGCSTPPAPLPEQIPDPPPETTQQPETEEQPPADPAEPAPRQSVALYGGVLPQRSGPDRLLTLHLWDDGSARFQSDFQDGRLPLLEVGTWVALDDGFRLTLTGTRRLIYDEPRVVEFERYVAGIIAVSYDSTIFGVRPMVLEEVPLRGEPRLEETAWQLASLPGVDRAVDGESYTLIFDRSGALSGRADCNRISSQFVAMDGELTLSAVAMTRAACPEGSLGNRFAAALSAAGRYSVDADELLLFAEDGTVVAVFRRAPLN